MDFPIRESRSVHRSSQERPVRFTRRMITSCVMDATSLCRACLSRTTRRISRHSCRASSRTFPSLFATIAMCECGNSSSTSRWLRCLGTKSKSSPCTTSPRASSMPAIGVVSSFGPSSDFAGTSSHSRSRTPFLSPYPTTNTRRVCFLKKITQMVV